MTGLMPWAENIAASFAYSCACASKNVAARILTAFTGAIALGVDAVRQMQPETRSLSLVAHTLHSYWPRSPLRDTPCYCPHIPNPAYHRWWGWAYYVQALDHPTEELYERSLVAFDQFASQSTRSPSADITDEEYARLVKLDRLFPLTQLALRRKQDAAVNRLTAALIECDKGLLSDIASIKSDDDHLTTLGSDANAIVCRYFAHVFHMCYAAKARFAPGAQQPRGASEQVCCERNRLIADKLYARSVDWNYAAVAQKVWPGLAAESGPNQVEGFLPVEWRVSRWLREHLPGSTVMVTGAAIALSVLYAATNPAAWWWLKWPLHRLPVPHYLMEIILTDLASWLLATAYLVFIIVAVIYSWRPRERSMIGNSRNTGKGPADRA